jgi:hypothetical protein
VVVGETPQAPKVVKRSTKVPDLDAELHRSS